ncbi:MAG: hypothetical protein E6G91_15005 [Alphaproteobacteria bacterium]|nr:MAG: hypothetical protein E6G91_15005 [Alphaproteobacteria bacterium]
MSLKNVREACAELFRRMLGATRTRTYRPERYYMRGPGPKCRERRRTRGHRGSFAGGLQRASANRGNLPSSSVRH